MGQVALARHIHNEQRPVPILQPRAAVGWVEDNSRRACQQCNRNFTMVRRRHHCRLCGDLVCNRCSRTRVTTLDLQRAHGHNVPQLNHPVRCCDACDRDISRARQARALAFARIDANNAPDHAAGEAGDGDGNGNAPARDMDGGLDLLRLLIRAHGIEREDGGEGEGEDGLRQRVRQQRAHAAVLALILESMREDAQPQYRGASAETVAALPKTVVTHEWLAAQQDSARTCSLCLEGLQCGDHIICLPCKHIFHRSPPMPAHDALPATVSHDGRELRLVREYAQLQYQGGWLCDVCEANCGESVPLYHCSDSVPGRVGGFDMCIRCAVRKGHVSPGSWADSAANGADVKSRRLSNKWEEEACGGIEHWLATHNTCPVCRMQV